MNLRQHALASLICRDCQGTLYSTPGFGNIPYQEMKSWRRDGPSLSFQRSKADLDAAASRGCKFCQLICSFAGDMCFETEDDRAVKIHLSRSTLNWAEWLNSSPFDNDDKKFCIRKGDSRIPELDFDTLYVSFGSRESTTQLLVTPWQDDPAAEYLSVRGNISDISSPAAFEIANKWVTECYDEHLDCLTGHKFMPNRLIDVSHQDLMSNDLKLVIRSRDSAPSKYTALSYCWGGPQILTTSQNNLESRLQGFKSSFLPKTLQDAILVTRQLGILYLWIDSLCIVQDSEDDKLAEIMLMRQIYANSFVTIVASSASKVEDGFLERRELVDTPHYVDLPYHCVDGRFGNITVRFPEVHVRQLEPVNLRAWTFQERLLSPRLLVYSSKGLVWECKRKRYLEVGVIHGTIAPDSRARNLRESVLPFCLYDRIPTTGSEDERWLSWKRVVENYTFRQMTDGRDKLVAIGAVAEEASLTWNMEYIAGIWKEFLFQGLLWCRPSRGNADAWLPRLKTYRAPSWSWASVDGPCMFTCNGGQSWRDVADVVEWKIDPETPEFIYGQVRGGYLKLRGRLRHYVFDGENGVGPEIVSSSGPIRAVLFVDQSNYQKTCRNRVAESVVPPPWNTVLFSLLPDTPEDWAAMQKEIWCLPISAVIPPTLWSGEGLVLQETVHNGCAGAGERSFRRIGWFEYKGEDLFAGLPVQDITVV